MKRSHHSSEVGLFVVQLQAFFILEVFVGRKRRYNLAVLLLSLYQSDGISASPLSTNIPKCETKLHKLGMKASL